MKPLVETSDRKPGEFIAFGMAAGGNILAAAGIITTTPWVAVLGAIMMGIGALYLLATEKE